MKSASSYPTVDNKVVIIFIMVLILNTVMVGFGFNFIRSHYTDTQEKVVYKQVMAEDLLEYSRKLAQDLGVQDRPPVREVLAGFNYDIALSKDSDELSRVIFNSGRHVQEVILKEWDALFREKIINLINQDGNIKKRTDKIEITLRVSSAEGAVCEPEFLHEDTLEEVNKLYGESGMSQDQVFCIEVEEGRSRMLVPYNPLDYIQTLTEELNALRVNLHEVKVASGYAEMAGPGIEIKFYDAQNGFEASDIIHDADVRDMINELFAAGAKGVAIGGQRLIATSPIRCVGPVIRVNQKEISANPVIIEAIGEPEVLSSGLDIIRFSLEFHRNFRIDIDIKENIVLPPYRS
ncbi:MAG TPA: DUF881 domain-containing protein [Firmicutes bacterium]|nr:DUF881 domain-containing protein [Bacillota bacterium]